MEIKIGLQFSNKYMPGYSFKVMNIIPMANQMRVEINPNQEGRLIWEEVWNLQHSQWAFERNEYSPIK